MIIRKGEEKDMARVLQLIVELAVFEKSPNAVVITVEDLVRDGFGESPLFHTFIAEIDGKIVGIALYYYSFSTWKGRTIHLEDLIVTEESRGLGVGFALYSEVMKQGLADNVGKIEWIVLDWNIDAIEFYKKSGAQILDHWLLVKIDKNDIATFVENQKSKN